MRPSDEAKCTKPNGCRGPRLPNIRPFMINGRPCPMTWIRTYASQYPHQPYNGTHIASGRARADQGDREGTLAILSTSMATTFACSP